MKEENQYEILAEVRERLHDLSGSKNIEYERQADSLKFYSNDQWDEDIKRKRGKRPTPVTNFARTYVDRVVNPYILNPVAIAVEDDSDYGPIIKETIREVEHDSCATEAYQTALRTAVACGRGAIHVGTYYANDETMDQSISIDSVMDPLSCYLDPASSAVDGSDATYGMWIKYISETESKNYGVDEQSTQISGVYEYWQIPDNSIPSLVYYKKVPNRKRRQWLVDGRYVDTNEDYPDAVKSRMVEHPQVQCIHIIGDKIISDTTYDMPYIPIVPVYGNVLYTERGIEYGGIIDQVRDTQILLNYYNASEAELVGLAPKSPWIAAVGQIEGFEAQWKQANSVAFDVLPYNPTDIAGHQVPLPQRADNTAQTQGLIASKTNAVQDLARETAIHDPQFGDQSVAGESGRSIIARNSQGEIATAHYTDNLHKSIAQVGRVLLYLMKNVYDTPRTVIVDNEPVEIMFGDIPLNIQNYDFKVTTGPAIESKKQEAVEVMKEMMMVNPAAAPLLAVRIVENLNIPNREQLVEDMKRVLPPELQEQDDEAPDPVAVQAMQEAQMAIGELEQQNEYLMGIVQQLQTSIIDDDKDRQAKLAEAEMKAQVDLAGKEIDYQKAIEVANINAKAKAQSEAMKQAGDSMRTSEQIAADAESDVRNIVANAIQSSEPDMVSIEKTEVTEMPRVAPMVEGPVYREDVSAGAIESLDDLME